jgi:hypothetical protein
MRIHISLVVVICGLTSLLGGFIGHFSAGKPKTQTNTKVRKEVPTKGLLKEIVIQNDSGELYCPPLKKRRCIVFHKLSLPNGEICHNKSCNSIEQKLEIMEENFESLKKFCVPDCQYQLELTEIDLSACISDLKQCKTTQYYWQGPYYP